MLRFTLAAALVAAVVAPPAAHAWTCSPHVEKKTYTVGDQSVDAYGFRWIC